MTPHADPDLVYEAIAHHTRRDILTLLKAGPKPASAIVREFAVSQPAVSRQLRVLLDAALVTAETAGRQRIYKINSQRLGIVRDWIERTIEDPAGHVWVLRLNKKGR